jgi:hypothetical protein
MNPQAGLHAPPPPLLDDAATPPLDDDDVTTPLLDDVTAAPLDVPTVARPPAPLAVVFAPPLPGFSTTTEPHPPRASSTAPRHPTRGAWILEQSMKHLVVGGGSVPRAHGRVCAPGERIHRPVRIVPQAVLMRLPVARDSVGRSIGTRHPGAIGEGRAAVKGFPRWQPTTRTGPPKQRAPAQMREVASTGVATIVQDDLANTYQLSQQ